MNRSVLSVVCCLGGALSPLAADALSEPPALEINEQINLLNPQSAAAVALVPELIQIVADEASSPVLRQRAAMTLGRIGTPAADAVPLLMRLLDAPPIRDDEPSERAAGAGHSVRYWALKSLGLFGRDARSAVPRLERELQDRQRPTDDRILVADVLGQIGTGAALDALGRELLRSAERSDDLPRGRSLLRQVIIDSFAYSGPDGIVALPSLVRVLSDADADVRRKACEALGRLGPRAEPAVDSLAERVVLDDSAAVRDAAADALSRLGPAAIPVLAALLQDGDAEMKWRAARALGRAGRWSLAETETLQAASADDDDQVRITALEALWQIHRNPAQIGTAAISELGRGDRDTRKRASQLLLAMKPLPGALRQELERLAVTDSDDAARAAQWVLRRHDMP